MSKYGEPWHVDDVRGLATDSNGFTIAEPVKYEAGVEANREMNARAVACVNFCRNLTDEQLAALTPIEMMPLTKREHLRKVIIEWLGAMYNDKKSGSNPDYIYDDEVTTLVYRIGIEVL